MRWYAIQTASNYERRVRDEAEAQQIESYLPQLTRTTRFRGARQTVEYPLFRGYVFGRFDPRSRQLDVLRIHGAVRILGSLGQPEPIPDEQIEAVKLMMRLPAGAVEHSAARLAPGTPVRVKCGPLQGLEGEFVRSRGRCRITVRVEMLGQSVTADIAAEDVVAIPVRKAA